MDWNDHHEGLIKRYFESNKAWRIAVRKVGRIVERIMGTLGHTIEDDDSSDEEEETVDEEDETAETKD